MTSENRIRFLVLNLEDNNKVSEVYRLEKDWILRFFLGPNLTERAPRIFVNHPANEKDLWDKNSYWELQWSKTLRTELDVCVAHADVKMMTAGSFEYFFTVNGSKNKESASGSGFFLVDPVLLFGKEKKTLPLNGIVCQTVLPKLLGFFPEWFDRLIVAKKTGYNAIHFTPIQELGASNSAYALKNQLKLNPIFNTRNQVYDFEDMKQLVQLLNDEHELLSFGDLVLNHTANESPWILNHPECTYNLVNSPHLKPAFILDRALNRFTVEIADCLWKEHGIPAELRTEEHLTQMAFVLHHTVLPSLHLSEFFKVLVDDIILSFHALIVSGMRGDDDDHPGLQLAIISDPMYRRLYSTIDLLLAVKLFYNSQPCHLSGDEKIKNSIEELRCELERLNASADGIFNDHLSAAVINFVANARYRFVDEGGPKLARVTRFTTIMNRYFVMPLNNYLDSDEEMIHDQESALYVWAHNGWVGKLEDPLVNFAEAGSNVYLRRELNSWEDSVKLRYGSKPLDCPFLWEYMRTYVRQTSEIFDGIRLDNCHNTPIHVTEWMLAEARSVRPDLYVMAELFTGSNYFDNIFINRLGLNSIIREALGVVDARGLGRRIATGEMLGEFFQLPLRPLVSSVTRDILFDVTHDNPSILETRTVLDVLPTAALVSMATCAIASNRGYDELIPHHIDILNEKRLYRSWSESAANAESTVGIETGVIKVKKILNELHYQLICDGFSQSSVNHLTDDVISITRYNPMTWESVILVAHTAFHEMESGTVISSIPTFPIQGLVKEVTLEAKMVVYNGQKFTENPTFLCGFENFQLVVHEHVEIRKSEMIEVILEENGQKLIKFIHFPPGSIVILRVCFDSYMESCLDHLQKLLVCFGYKMQIPSILPGDTTAENEFHDILCHLSFVDLNYILFRCHEEEKDEGFGVYNIPGYGTLPFCGIQGVLSVLMNIHATNDLQHPLCRNLIEGNWLMDYLSDRLLFHPNTKRLGNFFRSVFSNIKLLPRNLVPCYFDAFVTGVFVALQELAWSKMSDFIRNGSSFVHALALASLQVCGVARTAPLPALSPFLHPPHPEIEVDEEGHPQHHFTSIAAGLPHFSTGFFRCWGRDTFISLRGLLLIPGRFDEARFIILAFAGCLYNGLIPNFMGSTNREPRYNSRDAIWWWLQSIQEYCKMAPQATGIFQDKVSRRYLSNDDQVLVPGSSCDQFLYEVIQDSLERHANGIHFRESNAIDNDMNEMGFEINAGVDWKTGFVYGGNEHNCGTWMDKMGSSEAAGNRGRPATPRDGSAVELVALCYSAIKWLSRMSSLSEYPYSGVSIVNNDINRRDMTFKDWSELIKENFEKKFWIDHDRPNDLNPKFVNRHGIYRDLYGSSQEWTGYQLRPNFAIAIAIAPDLCDTDHAWHALERTGEILMGPLGMKTLDPCDWNYSGHYSSTNWSNGFNYHQGPEWIWPVGFFLRACLRIAYQLEKSQPGILRDTLTNIERLLSAHNTFIHVSDWKSLPELTNENGAFCNSSCPSQAWSIGCIIDAVYDYQTFLKVSSSSDVTID